MDKRRESVEREEVQPAACMFDDEAYLAMLSTGDADAVQHESRSRPADEMMNSYARGPHYETDFKQQRDRNTQRVQFREETRRGIPQFQPDEDGLVDMPPSFRASHQKAPERNDVHDMYSNHHTQSFQAKSSERLDTAGQAYRDFSERSPSPIKDMNYFEGINAIREEQNAFYQNLLQQQSTFCSVTSEVLKRTRGQVAQNIQNRFYDYSWNKHGKRSNSKNRNLRSRQHDEFAILNYYTKVSKYDLDRADLRIRDAMREKQARRIENARAKRNMINYQTSRERTAAVRAKVSRIRDLSAVKDTQKNERRANAMRHQEMLKNFLDAEKASRFDERPIQYGDGNSVFGPNTSMYLD